VRVALKPGARALTRAGGEPLLAEWARGRGRVIALASDAWSLSEAQWGGLLAPASAPRLGDGQLLRRGTLLRYEDAPDAPLPTRLWVDGIAQRWRPISPGLAVAPLPPGPVGLVEVESPSRHGRLRARVTRPPPEELAATGIDAAALEAQARLTGGLMLNGPSDLRFLDGLGRVGRLALAPWLLWAALLLTLWDAALWRGGWLSRWRPRRG
ncbi:hypothetical protein KKF91_20740, partial [Myxococcota bacterium]|nr:hypothetical protein [Myxococcota bacterium]